jgi:hypothetical protein
MDRGHTTVGYMFGFLMVDNTGTLPKAVEQVLEVLDKFSVLSIADPTIRNWIRLVREDAVLMVRRYEMELYSLCWGRQFWPAEVPDLLHFPNLGCQVMVSENQWEEEWMPSCSQTCWWRQEHRNFMRKFKGGFERWFLWRM